MSYHDSCLQGMMASSDNAASHDNAAPQGHGAACQPSHHRGPRLCGLCHTEHRSFAASQTGHQEATQPATTAHPGLSWWCRKLVCLHPVVWLGSSRWPRAPSRNSPENQSTSTTKHADAHLSPKTGNSST